MNFEHLPIPFHLIKVAGVLVLGFIANRMLTIAMRKAIFAQKLSTNMRELFLKILRFVLIAITALIILDSFGISITPILASLGVSSIAVALALQDTLGNWFSGIYILVDKPFEVGDVIRLDSGVEGTVTDIGWRSTHLRSGANNVVVVPNTKVSSSLITNYSSDSPEIVFTVELTVPADGDLDKIARTCERAADEVTKKLPGAVMRHSPAARYQTFSDVGAKVEVSLRAKTLADVADVRHEFIKTAQAQLKVEGVRIPVRLS